MLSRQCVHYFPYPLLFVALRNTTTTLNGTFTTPDMGSGASVVGAAPTTTDITNTFTASTTTSFVELSGHYGQPPTPDTPWWFWPLVAVCFLLLFLTLANVYVLRRRARRAKMIPEGQVNLLAEQLWRLISTPHLIILLSSISKLSAS